MSEASPPPGRAATARPDGLDTALTFARDGLRVVPERDGQLLAPAEAATTSATRIRRWWRDWPDAIPHVASGSHAANKLAPQDDGGELLDDLAAFVRQFVVLTPAQATVVALWAVHAHAIDAADATPYLAITSAEKRSGKTRLLEVLELLVPLPQFAANISEASLFRSVGATDQPPTLLFDEIDAIFGPKARDREDLRGMLNAGYRRGAVVVRVVGEGASLEAKRFPVFCCKAFAGIGSLPDTIADRSVPIRLQRRAPSEQVERFRYRQVKTETTILRQRAVRFARQSLEALRDALPDLPNELDDRAQDVTEPLLAIADAAGGDWPTRARAAVVELLAGRTLEDQSIGVRLLGDVRSVFGGSDRIATAALLERLNALDEAPWSEWRHGNGLSPRSLATLLERYGIRSRSIRLADGTTPKGFKREQFKAAWSRYLVPKTPHRHNPHGDAETADSAAATPQDVWRNAGGRDPAPDAGCGGVAAEGGSKPKQAATVPASCVSADAPPPDDLSDLATVEQPLPDTATLRALPAKRCRCDKPQPQPTDADGDVRCLCGFEIADPEEEGS